MNKYIDLKNVPKKKVGNKKQNRWEKCYKTPCEFEYKDTKGIMYITYLRKKMTGNKKVSVLLVEFEEFSQEMVPSMIIKCSFGGLLGYKTTEYKYNIGDIVNGSKVIEQIRIYDKYSSTKAYKMLCLETKGLFEMRESNLKNGQKSPYLRGYKVNEGNSLSNEPHVLNYLKNKEVAKTLHRKSGKKVEVLCKKCGYEKEIVVHDLVKYGFSCPFCTEGISFPERFMASLLKINNIHYEFQKSFVDLPRKRFDFYLPELNVVIEMNGKQHYKDVPYFKNNRTFESDSIKQKYCRLNNIGYIPINCSVSSFDFIIHNIKKTDLEFLMINITKKQISDEMTRTFVNENIKDIIKDYEKGDSYRTLIKRYNLKNKSHLIAILKRMGVYTYRDGGKLNSKKIICINNKRVFESVREAMNYAGLNSSSHIVQVCKGKRNTSGKDPVTGEPLKWMYYDEFKNA